VIPIIATSVQPYSSQLHLPLYFVPFYKLSAYACDTSLDWMSI